MIYNILIVGFGNIGFRHFESINNSKYKLNISIIDNNAKQFKNIKQLKINHEINTYTKLGLLKKKFFFLTIVSTTSKERFKLLKKIKERVKSKNWIIEKVLEQSKTNLQKINRLFINHKNCWVNSPYAMMPTFIDIKKKKFPKFHTFVVEGTEWGMACNLFHYIIVHKFIFNKRIIKNILVDKNNKWNSAKRSGYFEIYGQITVEFNNSKLIVICKKGLKNRRVYKLYDNKNTIQYIHGNNYFIKNNKKYYADNIILQSKLTSIYLDQLIESKKCSLPKLSESIKLHIPLIEKLHEHWNKYFDIKSPTVPIT